MRGGARVVGTVAGRTERTVRLARAAGLELLPGLADVIGVADVVLSIVPPDQAEAVAAELAGARLLADLNAVSPATARRISGEVDGSISGPPPQRAGTTRIYLSGPRAAEVAALPFDGVEVIVVGDEVGAASAVKMSTASVYKGSIALLDAGAAGGRPLRRRSSTSCPISASLRTTRAAASPDRRRRPTATSARCTRSAPSQAAAGLDPALFEAMAEVWAGSRGRGSARSRPRTRAPSCGRCCGSSDRLLVQRELPEGLEVRDADADEP